MRRLEGVDDQVAVEQHRQSVSLLARGAGGRRGSRVARQRRLPDREALRDPLSPEARMPSWDRCRRGKGRRTWNPEQSPEHAPALMRPGIRHPTAHDPSAKCHCMFEPRSLSLNNSPFRRVGQIAGALVKAAVGDHSISPRSSSRCEWRRCRFARLRCSR